MREKGLQKAFFRALEIRFFSVWWMTSRSCRQSPFLRKIPVLALHSLTGLGASSELYLLLRPSGHPRTGTQLPFGKADQTLNTTNGIHLLLASEFTFSDIRKWLSAQRPFWPLATRCQLINLEGGSHVGFFSFSDTKSPTRPPESDVAIPASRHFL